MPKLSRWFVKSALLCLLLGSALTALTLAGDLLTAGPVDSALAALRPLSWHLLTMGWATELIFGVAYWMFPLTGPAGGRSGAPRGDTRRGDERLGWTAFALFNTGLLLRALGEPLATLQPGPAAGLLLPLSALAQVAALALFVIFMWPRIRPLGK